MCSTRVFVRMPGSVVRVFTVYEFFGIFLPGLSFLIWMLPFLSLSGSVGSLSADITPIFLIILSSFIFGQMIHSLSQVMGHEVRDKFVEQMRQENKEIKEFKRAAKKHFRTGICSTTDYTLASRVTSISQTGGGLGRCKLCSHSVVECHYR